jgi:hypothetical protein
MLNVNQMMIAAVDAAKWMICCVDERSRAVKNTNKLRVFRLIVPAAVVCTDAVHMLH